MVQPESAYLTGSGASFASGRLTNHDLVARFDTSLAWLDDNIGISERRVVSDGEKVTTLGADAYLATGRAETIAVVATEQTTLGVDTLRRSDNGVVATLFEWAAA